MYRRSNPIALGPVAALIAGGALVFWWMNRSSKQATGGLGIAAQSLPLPTSPTHDQFVAVMAITQKQLRSLGYRINRTDGVVDDSTREAGRRFVADAANQQVISRYSNQPTEYIAIMAIDEVYRRRFGGSATT